MSSLPAANDDYKNMKHTVEQMMGVPKENIFDIKDATFDQLEKV